jgi:hypothetical protein
MKEFVFAISIGLITGACSAGPPQALPDKPVSAPAALGQSFTIESGVLGETRRINVYTPPGYNAHAGARFPVLYMPDGGTAEDFPHVTGTVQSLVTAGAMRPFIVVGIENTERRRESLAGLFIVETLLGPVHMAVRQDARKPLCGRGVSRRAESVCRCRD